MLVNVFRDASHFYAKPVVKRKSSERDRRARDEFDEEFDKKYFELLNSGLMNNRKGRNELYDRLFYSLRDNENVFAGKNDDERENAIRERLSASIINKAKAAYARKTRFFRKGNFNAFKWTHFVTQTYNSELMDEEEFVRRWTRFMANAAYRHGWLCIGAFERAPETKRLHFHGVFYIPYGEEIGKIEEVNEYNPLTHRTESRFRHSYLEEKFGRCDFEPINVFEISHGNVLEYIMKYTNKSGMRLRYSRGIPSGLKMLINRSLDAMVEEESTIEKISEGEIMVFTKTEFILFDNVIDGVEKSKGNLYVNYRGRPREAEFIS